VLAGATQNADEYELQLQPKEGFTAAALASIDVVLVIDSEVTPEMEKEGFSRDFVRVVQQACNDSGLHISAGIVLSVEADAATKSAFDLHAAYIAEQVLAEGIDYGEAATGAFSAEGKVGSGGGNTIRFAVAKRIVHAQEEQSDDQ